VNYLKSAQWSDKIQGVPDDQKPKDDKDVRTGGWGYGGTAAAGPISATPRWCWTP